MVFSRLLRRLDGDVLVVPSDCLRECPRRQAMPVPPGVLGDEGEAAPGADGDEMGDSMPAKGPVMGT